MNAPMGSLLNSAAIPAPVTHDVVIVRSKKAAQAKAMAVPPEEFGIKKSARNIKDSNYCFHKLTQLTEADLLAQGYDEDQVKALPAYNPVTNTEEISRDTVNEYQLQGSGQNRSTRQIEVIEHYIRMDYEGNGRACLYKVTTGGSQGEILRKNGKPDIEPVDAMPFAAMTPVIVTHRFFGRSIADLVIDIQKIKTALMRGALDNLYLHNNPRVEVAEQMAGPNTLDDLLVSRPGGIVRTKVAGGLQWQVVPDITPSVYPALEYMDSVLENRTGVTKRGQGLDADALMNQSATAAQLGHNAAQERMKLIARIFAETGVKDLFLLLHGLIRKHGKEAAKTVRLRNKWVKIDPRDWKTRNDMTVKVGIGSGGKSEQIAVMNNIIGLQAKAIEAGKTNLVSDKNLFNSAEQFCAITGHKDVKRFFNDPEEKDEAGNLVNPPPQPQPDPAVMKIQADAQLKQMELQQRGQEMQVQAQIDQQSDERKAQIESVQAQADIATQERKTQAEMALAQQKFEFDKELALINAALEREKFEREEARKEREHAQTMQQSAEQHRQSMEAGVFKVAQGQQAHEQRMEQAATKEPAK